jgi:hypothetical protein
VERKDNASIKDESGTKEVEIINVDEEHWIKAMNINERS